jgi:hypothetical protein
MTRVETIGDRIEGTMRQPDMIGWDEMWSKPFDRQDLLSK